MASKSAKSQRPSGKSLFCATLLIPSYLMVSSTTLFYTEKFAWNYTRQDFDKQLASIEIDPESDSQILLDKINSVDLVSIYQEHPLHRMLLRVYLTKRKFDLHLELAELLPKVFLMAQSPSTETLALKALKAQYDKGGFIEIAQAQSYNFLQLFELFSDLTSLRASIENTDEKIELVNKELENLQQEFHAVRIALRSFLGLPDPKAREQKIRIYTSGYLAGLPTLTELPDSIKNFQELADHVAILLQKKVSATKNKKLETRFQELKRDSNVVLEKYHLLLSSKKSQKKTRVEKQEKLSKTKTIIHKELTTLINFYLKLPTVETKEEEYPSQQ